VTIRNELARLRGLLKFLEARDYSLDPDLFRVQPPKVVAKPLPRYLPEVDYCQFSGVNVPPLFGKDAPLIFGNDVPPLFGQMHHLLGVRELH
jgi:hypothetical protein